MIEDFPTGESCFIDANILGYASVEVRPFTASWRSFLARVATGEIFAFTSANAVADALFKTMMMILTPCLASRSGNLDRIGLAPFSLLHTDLSHLSLARRGNGTVMARTQNPAGGAMMKRGGNTLTGTGWDG